MQLKFFVLALFFSTEALSAGRYHLQSVPHKDIDKYLVIASDATSTPENIQGLWWMDGNPLADEVLSFAGMSWSAIEERGEVVGFDEGVWAWHDSLAGRLLYNLVLKAKLTYHVVFNADFTAAQITPVFKPIGLLPGFELPPSFLVDFALNAVNENEYSRDSILFGAPHTYRFRRIVDGQGVRLPAFDEFVKKAEVPNALIPVCNQAGQQLPTACAN